MKNKRELPPTMSDIVELTNTYITLKHHGNQEDIHNFITLMHIEPFVSTLEARHARIMFIWRNDEICFCGMEKDACAYWKDAENVKQYEQVIFEFWINLKHKSPNPDHPRQQLMRRNLLNLESKFEEKMATMQPLNEDVCYCGLMKNECLLNKI
jgi:hypothetical protein